MLNAVTASLAFRERRPLPHILDASTFDRAWVEAIITRAEAIQTLGVDSPTPPLRGRIMATLFYEPSTRTRFSFEAAMLRLGGQVIAAEDASKGSSAVKGETLEDTVRIIAGYSDLIVLRHPEMGAAARAAHVSPVPVINAGDGAGQHPTQALLDLFTIKRELGRLYPLRVGIAGDLKHGRTVRSLSLILSAFPGNELVLIAPPELVMQDDILSQLRARGVAIQQEQDLVAVAPTLDVLYQTRIQKERFTSSAEYERMRCVYIVDKALMRRLPEHAILMHPLPRVDEIDPAVDKDPRAAYFRQARNGLAVRMAVLEWLVPAA